MMKDKCCRCYEDDLIKFVSLILLEDFGMSQAC